MTKARKLELIGETDGINEKGTLSLISRKIVGEITYFQVGRGVRVMLLSYSMSGGPVTVRFQYTHDCSAPDPVWQNIRTELILPSDKGTTEVTKDPPKLILEGMTGKEAFRIAWEQDKPAKSTLAFEFDVGD